MSLFVESFAQESVKAVVLSQEYLEKTLGTDWKGIVYVCAPYCRFVSLKEISSWNPGLKDEEVDKENIRLVKNSDPLYPLLVAKQPVLPYVEGSEGLAGKDLENALSPPLADLPPAQIVAPFGFGWAIQTGIGISQRAFETDTVIQSELAPNGPVISNSVQLEMMKGKPFKFWKFWMQLQGSFLREQSMSFPVTAMNIKTQRSRQTILFNPAVAVGKLKLSPGYLMETETLTTSLDSLGHYGWIRTSHYFRLGYQPSSRWSLSYDYLIRSEVTERQSFRVSPLRLDTMRLNIQYCSRSFEVFDLSFGLCSGVSYLKDQQVADIDPAILEGKSSTLRWSEIQGRVTMRFGEDLFQ